MHLFNFLKFKH